MKVEVWQCFRLFRCRENWRKICFCSNMNGATTFSIAEFSILTLGITTQKLARVIAITRHSYHWHAYSGKLVIKTLTTKTLDNKTFIIIVIMLIVAIIHILMTHIIITLIKMALSIKRQYVECRIFSALCWVSLCWVSLCCLSWRRLNGQNFPKVEKSIHVKNFSNKIK